MPSGQLLVDTDSPAHFDRHRWSAQWEALPGISAAKVEGMEREWFQDAADGGEPVREGMFVLQSLCNRRIAKDVERRLVRLDRGTMPVETRRGTPGMLVLRDVPSSLLAALWLWFADSLMSPTAWNECEGCGRLFATQAGVPGRPRRHCTDGCKSRVFRRSRDQAVQMATEGIPIAEVADRLGREPGQVRKWVERSLGK